MKDGGVDSGAGLRAEDPLLAGGVRLGVEHGVLHEGVAAFGEGAFDLVGVYYVADRAGEELVEADGFELSVGGGAHAGVDVVEALEVAEVDAGLVDGGRLRGAVEGGHAGAGLGQVGGVGLEVGIELIRLRLGGTVRVPVQANPEGLRGGSRRCSFRGGRL